MQFTDLADIAILDDLNCSLADALGLAMALTDEDGLPITASADWDNEDHDGSEVAAVPVRIDGMPVVTWHCKKSSPNGRAEDRSRNRYRGMCHSSSGRSRAACDLIEKAPAVQEGAIALLSSVARMISGYAYANLGMLRRVQQHAAAALEATADAVAMQRLVDGSPVGLLEFDREGSVCWANGHVRDLLGIEEFESRGVAGPGAPWTIECINGMPYSVAWIGVARRLLKGETVHDLACALSRSRGRTLNLRVDAAPVRSENGRLTRVMCAISEANGQRVTPVHNLSTDVTQQCVEPLTHAWLELDAARQSLKRGEVDVAGQLDLVAALLQETACTIHEAQFRSG